MGSTLNSQVAVGIERALLARLQAAGYAVADHQPALGATSPKAWAIWRRPIESMPACCRRWEKHGATARSRAMFETNVELRRHASRKSSGRVALSTFRRLQLGYRERLSELYDRACWRCGLETSQLSRRRQGLCAQARVMARAFIARAAFHLRRWLNVPLTLGAFSTCAARTPALQRVGLFNMRRIQYELNHLVGTHRASSLPRCIERFLPESAARRGDAAFVALVARSTVAR